jgi:hypothetical protein
VRKHHDESPFKTQSALPASLAPSISHDHKLFRCTRVGPTVWTSNNKFQRPSPNERTCMGWHERYALVVRPGLEGHFTSRGAKPNGLKNMLRDLILLLTD